MSMPEIPIPEGLDTKRFLLSDDALTYLPEFLKEVFPGKSVWLVADDNTWKAAGARAKEYLTAAGMTLEKEYIFPGTPKLHPEYDHSVMLAGIMPENCVPVSIGSGVVNDLVKCASGIKEVPYCCVPTACSVDGYTASGAALSKNGTKQTVKCPPPWAVCADSSILMTAPPEMLASGYADLLTKIPAGADWIIADELDEDPIREDVWTLIQGNIRKWVSDDKDLLNIFEGLAATGYAMQMFKDSRPASGAEHLFSHIWEMEGLMYNGEDVSHGFKVGVGLLASTLLHEYILENDIDEIELPEGLTRAEREAEIDELLKKGCYGSAPRETALKKFKEGRDLTVRRNEIRACWKRLQERLKGQCISYNGLREMLKNAGCPVTAAGIGLDREQFLHGIRTAQLIRIRYTVLDFLYEAGLLEDAMKKLDIMVK